MVLTMVEETVEYKFSVLNTIECRPQPEPVLSYGGRFMVCNVFGEPGDIPVENVYSVTGDIIILSGKQSVWIKTNPICAKAKVAVIRRGYPHVPRGYDLKVKVV